MNNDGSTTYKYMISVSKYRVVRIEETYNFEHLVLKAQVPCKFSLIQEVYGEKAPYIWLQGESKLTVDKDEH